MSLSFNSRYAGKIHRDAHGGQHPVDQSFNSRYAGKIHHILYWEVIKMLLRFQFPLCG